MNFEKYEEMIQKVSRKYKNNLMDQEDLAQDIRIAMWLSKEQDPFIVINKVCQTTK